MAVNGLTPQLGCRGRSAHEHHGFAIARLLVAIAVVAIVSTVAVPISRDHLDSTHVAQAVADIGAIEIAIARFKARNRGELPNSLEDLGVQHWTDPWGNAYQYRNLEVESRPDQARRDLDMRPLNRDYDLYSMGKDGRSTAMLQAGQSADDVIRALSGSFYGPVADYPAAPPER